MPSLDDYLVATFRQGDFIQEMFPDDHASRTGICFGLCAEWMARHRSHKGESAQERIDHVGSWSTIMHANIKQRLYQEENWFDANSIGMEYVMEKKWLPQSGAKSVALNENNMTITSQSVKKVDVTSSNSITNVANYIKNHTDSSHRYSMISFSLVGGGAHATCGYKSGGKIAGIGSHFYYFEPNFGEFKVSTGNMTNLFKALIAAYRTRTNSKGEVKDYKIKQFYVQTISFM